MKADLFAHHQVLVAGDIAIDWFIALAEATPSQGISTQYLWESEASPTLWPNRGGSALVGQLLDAVFGQPGWEPCSRTGSPVPDRALHDPNWAGVVRSFSVWRRVARQVGDRELVWRMDRFVGWNPITMPPESSTRFPDAGRRACLFIEDGGQPFRSEPSAWSDIVEDGAEHIVLRQTGSLGQGTLWNALTSQHASRLTLVCAVGDLRREGAPIGKPLSWERTAQEVAEAVRSRPEIAVARRVIVLLATSGAVIVDNRSESVVLFDPFNQEGDWERNRHGIGFGAGTCSVVSIVAECTRNPDSPDFAAATRNGLLAARSMFDGGFDATIENKGWQIRFPIDRVARVVSGNEQSENPFQVARIRGEPEWRLFDTAFEGGFREAAQMIALQGERAAGQEIPIERMGAWSSVDRIEIEGMRSLRNIVSEYLSTSRKRRPLNLAVFGPPGSGKSFAIKQLAKELSGGDTRFSELEFNLSQFQSPEDLPAALQRVRDCSVQQTLPLVFWDEFDSAREGAELGWLVNFLAPMQDGAFVEHGHVRPNGPAIFVFAGGTHATMESFRNRAFELPGAKATDFLSRLRGYVNILGPNPEGSDDLTYSLRRAMLLRAVISGRAPQVFSGDALRIDPGILNAFLDVPSYFHGSRSMESVVEMSALHGVLRFERSALPALHQLALHVDAGAFMDIVARSHT